MFDLIEIPKNEIDNYYFFENVDVNFKYSINSNPNINPEIKKIYVRTLNNKAKFILDCFHLNVIWAAERIIQNNDCACELIDSLLTYISEFFDNVETNLKISNIHELEKLNFILRLTSITLDNAVKYNDVELAFESFFQVENRLEIEKLFVKNHSDI